MNHSTWFINSGAGVGAFFKPAWNWGGALQKKRMGGDEPEIAHDSSKKKEKQLKSCREIIWFRTSLMAAFWNHLVSFCNNVFVNEYLWNNKSNLVDGCGAWTFLSLKISTWTFQKPVERVLVPKNILWTLKVSFSEHGIFCIQQFSSFQETMRSVDLRSTCTVRRHWLYWYVASWLLVICRELFAANLVATWAVPLWDAAS